MILKNARSHAEARAAGPRSRSAAERTRAPASAPTRAAVPDRRPATLQLAKLGSILNPQASPDTAADPGGLPSSLKAGVERLSGLSMDHVRVHRNSAKPAQLNAHALAQGAEIHLGPGQDKHLPHEAWHVVQQAQGRVRPTIQLRAGGALNDEAALEREADAMGARAAALGAPGAAAARGRPQAFAGGSHPRPMQPVRRARARTGAAVLQPKGGQEWATARALSMVGGVLNEALAAIIVEVLEDHTQAAIQNALGAPATATDTRPLFTSRVRGSAVVRLHAAGLAVATIHADCADCANNASLGGLLDLSLAIQAGGGNPLAVQGAVRLGLLAARPPAAIQAAALAVPALLDTVPRALAIVDHLVAGGTAADAVRGAAFAPVDAGVLAQALTALRGLSQIPAAAALPQDKIDALLSERDHLTTPALAASAVNVAVAAANAQGAANELLRTRAFGYQPAFRDRADQRGAAAAATLVANRQQDVADAAANQRQQAVPAQNDAAFNTLTRNQRAALGGTSAAAAAAVSQPPPLFPSAYFISGSARFTAERAQRAAPQIQQIDADEQRDLAHVAAFEGPAREAQVRETFRAYFAGVHFHPDALAALDAVGENQPLATALVGVLAAAPSTRAVFLGGLAQAGIQRLVAVPAATLAALIAANVTAATVRSYAASDSRVALLVAMHGAGTPAVRISALEPLLAGLAAHVDHAPSRGHLVALLATETPADISGMLVSAPNPVLGRVGLVAAVRIRAANAADLTQVLALCTRLSFTHALVTQVLGTLPAGSPAANLIGAVHAHHLIRYDKNANFVAWLTAVGELIDEGYVRIRAFGAWARLASHPGSPVTDERIYDVELVAGGAVQETFYVHFHPGAAAAAVGSPNASRSHMKPQRGGIIRRDYALAPASVRNFTESHP